MLTSEVAVLKSRHGISVKCSRYRDTGTTDPSLDIGVTEFQAIHTFVKYLFIWYVDSCYHYSARSAVLYSIIKVVTLRLYCYSNCNIGVNWYSTVIIYLFTSWLTGIVLFIFSGITPQVIQMPFWKEWSSSNQCKHSLFKDIFFLFKYLLCYFQNKLSYKLLGQLMKTE